MLACWLTPSRFVTVWVPILRDAGEDWPLITTDSYVRCRAFDGRTARVVQSRYQLATINHEWFDMGMSVLREAQI